MPRFAVHVSPATCLTSRPAARIAWVGHSFPHFAGVRQALAGALRSYPHLPQRLAPLEAYGAVHTEGYLRALVALAADEPVKPSPRLSMECTGFWYCLPGYQYGLGGMCEAVDQMRAGTLERAYCFSQGGHHAYADWGHGYCLLNPLAAAARYAQRQGFARVLIVDWDIHHGDGTQSIFAHDTNVYCLSIHSALDLYMLFQRVAREGTTTRGEELGHRNLPLLSREFGDAEYAEIGFPGRFYRAPESLPLFQQALGELPWQPDIILIFSGYDSHRDDCGAGITDWTDADYRALTTAVLNLARQADCPVLSVHGGGYKLPVTLSAALAHVQVLAG